MCDCGIHKQHIAYREHLPGHDTSAGALIDTFPRHSPFPWWRHDMGTFSALLALCDGNSLVIDGFQQQSGALMFFALLAPCYGNQCSSMVSPQNGPAMRTVDVDA